MHLLLCGLLASIPFAWATAQEIITTSVGGGPRDIPAVQVGLPRPVQVLPDRAGGFYILSDSRLLRMDGAGKIQLLAGSLIGGGCQIPFGDGKPADQACFKTPVGLALDAQGNIYISDSTTHAVRRIDAVSGLISRYAGSYAGGYMGDGMQAPSARLNKPHALTFDLAGNLLIADRGNHAIRRVDAATGIISTLVGTGVATGSVDGEGVYPLDNLGDGQPFAAASLSSPYGVAVDAGGNIFIGDTGNLRVRRISAATGIITTVAGNGGFGAIGDGVPATEATLAGPAQVSVDSAGRLLIADSNDIIPYIPGDHAENHKVRRVDFSTGLITTVAGVLCGSGGDGGPANLAAVCGPTSVVEAGGGDLYIADSSNNRVRRIAASTGIITTVAGNGQASGLVDGYPAPHSILDRPTLVALDHAGNLAFFETGEDRIRRVSAATGLVTTIAGNGSGIHGGDGGPATSAGFSCVSDLEYDAGGNLFIADTCAQRVRRIDAATGIITTVAGTGTAGYNGDDRAATTAMLNTPVSVALNAGGDLFIADTDNQRIRRVRGGVITTVAGTGVATGEFDGQGGDPVDDFSDGAPASSSSLYYPTQLAVDASGNVLVTENARVRRIDVSTGIYATVIGDGERCCSGEGGPALSASIGTLASLDFGPDGDLFMMMGNDTIWRHDADTGLVSRYAGTTGGTGFSSDGSLATSARLNVADSLVVDGAGRVHVTEYWADRVRLVLPLPAGSSETGATLAVRRSASGDLSLDWGESCLATDNDYAVYEGALGDFASHAPRMCSTAGATAVTFTPASGDSFYLVVPRNGAREGSYGTTSAGAQRPASSAACAPQQVTQICD